MTDSSANTNLMMGFSVSLFTLLLSNVPWMSLFLLLRLIGIRYYHVMDKDIIQRIQRRIVHSTIRTESGTAAGYTIGRWYLAHIRMGDDGFGYRLTMWIVTTDASFKALTKEEHTTKSDDPTLPKKKMIVYERAGPYKDIYYRVREVSIKNIAPNPSQQVILEKITTAYKQNGHCVAMVYGPPGTGKSMLGGLLASEMRGKYCNTFRPWEPNTILADLYTNTSPTENSPLIISMDEFDCALLTIHAGLPEHPDLPTLIRNKVGWNYFLDEIDRGMYPYLILLLTTNRTPEFVCSLDPSYIREGRVSIIAELACPAV